MLRIILSFIILFSSCRSREVKSDLFSKADRRGKVSWDLEEVSGLVASQINPGYLWAINDSGNPAEIFLIDDKAKIVMTCKLKKIDNRDWEEIALGPGPDSTVNYLYVGEIGDNEAKYEYKYLYRLPEPLFVKDEKISISDFDTLVVVLPDGARDMESMAIDHMTGDYYLFSKREENINVYRVPKMNLLHSDTLRPKKLTTLPYHNTVAVDFSFDGSELLLKTYDEIYYWKKPDSLSIAQTLLTNPIKLNYKREPQGESLAWTLNGNGFYTLSESVDNEKANLYFYKKAK